MGLIGKNYSSKTVRPNNSPLQVKFKDEAITARRMGSLSFPLGLTEKNPTAHLNVRYKC